MISDLVLLVGILVLVLVLIIFYTMFQYTITPERHDSPPPPQNPQDH